MYTHSGGGGGPTTLLLLASDEEGLPGTTLVVANPLLTTIYDHHPITSSLCRLCTQTMKEKWLKK